MKKIVTVLLLCVLCFTGCTANNEKQSNSITSTNSTKSEAEAVPIADGQYLADFVTDSSMFHANETKDGKGELTVGDGKMTLHVSMPSKNIIKLYLGTAKEAVNNEEETLMPTTDTVTYADGLTEEVYGFDIPIPYLNREFDLALIGKKGKWYDHKVKVSNPEPISGQSEQNADLQIPEDGSYSAEIKLEGGAGKATLKSPTTIRIQDQKAFATLEWSSPNYDYMLKDGIKYLPINKEGNSIFELPISGFDQPMTVVGDTVAMSRPYEIEYQITIDSKTLKKQS